MTNFISDPQQPEVEFRFGDLPLCFRGIDTDRKIGVIGTNDVFIKFQGPHLIQRGGTMFLTNRSIARAEAAKQMVLAVGGQASVVDGVQGMPKDLHGIHVLTPPNAHLPLVKEIVEHLPNTPIFLEKPLVGNRKDLSDLQQYVTTNNVPVYFTDWMISAAEGMRYALGLPICFPDALEITNGEDFTKFDIKKVVKIDGRDIEGGGNSLGDPEQMKKARGWMFDYREGGGVMYDMNVHLANTLADMGFTSNGIHEVFLGSVTDKSGVYTRVVDNVTGELYGRAHMTLGIPGGNQNIETMLECGKNAAVNDQYIRLTDANGYVLHLEFLPADESGNRIMGCTTELWHESNSEKILAKIYMRTDCYALEIEKAHRFAAERHQGLKSPIIPSHFHSHVVGFEWVAAMHDMARGKLPSPEETIHQMALNQA